MMRPLRFDLRPRASRPLLRVALGGGLLSATVAAVVWLHPLHTEAVYLRAAAGAMVPPIAPAASTSVHVQPWQGTAQQDGYLFELPIDSRLLEIERCTDAKTAVTRIAHDAAVRGTSLELIAAEPEAVRSLLECLNQSGPGQAAWRLLSVEVQSSSALGAAPGQRVVLRYP